MDRLLLERENDRAIVFEEAFAWELLYHPKVCRVVGEARRHSEKL